MAPVFMENPLQRLLMGLAAGGPGIQIIRQPMPTEPSPNVSDKRVPACEGFINDLKIVSLEQAIEGKDDTGAECCICHIEYGEDPNEPLVQTPCSHVYHQECITNWLKKCHTCPMCREEFETNQIAYLRSQGKDTEADALEAEQRRARAPIRIPLSQLFGFGRVPGEEDEDEEMTENDDDDGDANGRAEEGDGGRRFPGSRLPRDGLNLIDFIFRSINGGSQNATEPSVRRRNTDSEENDYRSDLPTGATSNTTNNINSGFGGPFRNVRMRSSQDNSQDTPRIVEVIDVEDDGENERTPDRRSISEESNYLISHEEEQQTLHDLAILALAAQCRPQTSLSSGDLTSLCVSLGLISPASANTIKLNLGDKSSKSGSRTHMLSLLSEEGKERVDSVRMDGEPLSSLEKRIFVTSSSTTASEENQKMIVDFDGLHAFFARAATLKDWESDNLSANMRLNRVVQRLKGEALKEKKKTVIRNADEVAAAVVQRFESWDGEMNNENDVLAEQ